MWRPWGGRSAAFFFPWINFIPAMKVKLNVQEKEKISTNKLCFSFSRQYWLHFSTCIEYSKLKNMHNGWGQTKVISGGVTYFHNDIRADVKANPRVKKSEWQCPWSCFINENEIWDQERASFHWWKLCESSRNLSGTHSTKKWWDIYGI